MSRKWTAEQLDAITARGEALLVSAAAGSGKTSVLSERCASLVCDGADRCNVNQLLVVTFTELAAAEMKSRIEQAIRQRAQMSSDPHLRKQLKLIDHAQVSTLHSFCQRLIRQHFQRLDLDPEFTILDEDEALLMRHEVVRQLFADRYEAGDPAFADFIDAYGSGDDESLMMLVVSTHNLLTSLVRPEDWLETARRRIEEAATTPIAESSLGKAYLRNLSVRLRAMIDECDAAIRAMPAGFDGYVGYLQELAGVVADWHGLLESGDYDGLAAATRDVSWPRCPPASSKLANKDQARAIVERVQRSIKESSHIATLRFSAAEWQATMAAVRPHAEVFLALVDEFAARYANAKHDARGLDFSDLERLALNLLTDDRRTLRPSDVARACHRNYRHVLVDEYQDINQVQDAILALVSRECVAAPANGRPSNLFCVGDVKQSIYRFRLAEPQRFLEREERYRQTPPEERQRVIDLQSNFRSRKPLLDAVNAVFERLMFKPEIEIEYDQKHRLVAGAAYPDGDGVATFRGAPLELHILPPPAKITAPDDAGSSSTPQHDDLDRSDLEALLIVRRLREMMGLTGLPRMQVMERAGGDFVPRPMEYGDVVILLRSLRHKAEQFASMLRRYGIPCHCDGGAGFFQAVEVRDMLALLHVLDNQQQDIPLATVLRSPLVLLPRPDDALARIRLAYNDPEQAVPFHQAVVRYAQEQNDELAAALTDFLARLGQWRDAAHKRPLAEVIWTIFEETGYLAYCAGLEDGEQRAANLLHLHERARQFGTFLRQGLYRFLRFLENLERQTELGQPSLSSHADDAVRIMSIHASKGLEFPVVFLPDLGKRFNLQDCHGRILVDREAHLGMAVIDTQRHVTYPSLSQVVVRERMQRLAMAEELRLLYVAMTRAKEHLVMIATTDPTRPEAWQKRWTGHAGTLPAADVLQAGCMVDWLGPVTYAAAEQHPIELRAYDAEDVVQLKAMPKSAAPQRVDFGDLAALKPLSPPPPPDPLAQAVIARVKHQYDFADRCARPAVGSVTSLTHEHEPADRAVSAAARQLPLPKIRAAEADVSATDRGTFTHTVLEHLDFSQANDQQQIRRQVDALVARRILTAEQAAAVDLEAIAWLMGTPVGQLLRQQAGALLRELPFYLATDHRDCEPTTDPLDRLMVRGRIDLVIPQDGGFVVLDYKTDRVNGRFIDARADAYRGQVSLYRQALQSILGKPVLAAHLAFLTPRRIVTIT